MIVALRDFLGLVRHTYMQAISPVCDKHNMTRMEMDVLLFLSNNPHLNTATELVTTRHLTKSHVSQAIRRLTETGLLVQEHKPDNRKTIYLRLTPAATPAIQDGLAAQAEYLKRATEGLSHDDFEAVISTFKKISDNLLESEH